MAVAPLRDMPSVLNSHQGFNASQRFMLALSDQQLITGPALLVAAYIRNRTLSLYHFKIIESLAWFSAAVHLVGLTTLQLYFMDRLHTIYWRILWAVLFLCGLSIAQFVLVTNTDMNYSIACVFKDYNVPELPAQMFLNILIVSWLFDLYMDAILPIILRDLNWTFRRWLASKIKNGSLRFKGKDPVKSTASATSVTSHGECDPKTIAAQVLERFRQEETERYIAHAAWLSNCPAVRFRLYIGFYAFLNGELERSFLSKIITAISVCVYGIVSVVKARDHEGYEIQGDQSTMGFGQIMPLLLLFLPVFSAMDIYPGMLSHLLSPADHSFHARNARQAQRIYRSDAQAQGW